MRLGFCALAVIGVAMSGCIDESRTPAPQDFILPDQKSLDSFNRANADELLRARQRTLDARPDYLGAVTDIVAIDNDSTAKRVTIRLRLTGDHPSMSRQHIRIDIRGDGMAWRADRTPLPADSLRIGDWVQLWMGGSSAVLPIDPPRLLARALQRLDSLPPNR